MLTQNASIDQYLLLEAAVSRRDHQPYWLKAIRDRLNTAYIDHFIRPQLDSAGEDFRVMNPRSLELSGPNIHVANHVHVMALKDMPVRLSVFEGMGKIDVGSYSIINPGVRVTSANQISIGEGCMLAMGCYLSDADWHDLNHRIYAPGSHAPIQLGNNVWVGDGALVTKGVTVGDNSIIGARAVVTKDVPANSVVAGNPAKVVKTLSDEHITTRKDLFTMDKPYQQFESEYFRSLLAGNQLADYLLHLIKPRS